MWGSEKQFHKHKVFLKNVKIFAVICFCLCSLILVLKIPGGPLIQWRPMCSIECISSLARHGFLPRTAQWNSDVLKPHVFLIWMPQPKSLISLFKSLGSEPVCPLTSSRALINGSLPCQRVFTEPSPMCYCNLQREGEEKTKLGEGMSQKSPLSLQARGLSQ